MKKAFVELGLKLEKSVYKLGDSIKVHAQCRVEGGITDVNKVRTFDNRHIILRIFLRTFE